MLYNYFVLLNILYFFVIIMLITGIIRLLRSAQEEKDYEPSTAFSILIPVRNEEKRITDLLKSLKELNYPKDLIEVVFLDDESTDTTGQKIKWFISNSDFNVSYLVIKRIDGVAPKKNLIEKGVEQAKHEYILLLDADVNFSPSLLKGYNNVILESKADFIPGLVHLNYWERESVFSRVQALDFAGLISIGLGMAGLKNPSLCNGANLCFKKSSFLDVGGYSQYNHILSGDDVFLLEKMKKSGKLIIYNLNELSMVLTTPKPTFNLFLKQRARWGSKNFLYKNVGLMMLQLMFYSYYVLFFIIPLLSGIKAILPWFLLKSLFDAGLVYPFLKKFDKDRFLLRSLFVTELFQFIYLPLTGFYILARKYDWN